MSENSIVAAKTVAKAAMKAGRFDQVSIAFHWVTVLLIIIQFTTAWLHEGVGEHSDLSASVLAAHRSAGVLTWLAALARLVWRHKYAYLPPFPASMPKLQQSVAKANEYGLYGLILIQPLTGIGQVLFRGRDVTLFFWQIPALGTADKAMSGLFHEIHAIGANALLALIGLHVGAALLHGVVLRDGVLQRMLPWTRR